MVSAKFGDGAAGICLAMRSFIAVVIRQAVGDEHDKLIGHAGLLLEQLPGMPHGSTDSRKPGGPEQCEPLASLTAKTVIEPLHPQHMAALAPPAVERSEERRVGKEGGSR